MRIKLLLFCAMGMLQFISAVNAMNLNSSLNDNYQMCPEGCNLIAAAAQGDLLRVKKLLEADTTDVTKPYGALALLAAVLHCHTASAIALLAAGASTKMIDGRDVYDVASEKTCQAMKKFVSMAAVSRLPWAPAHYIALSKDVFVPGSVLLPWASVKYLCIGNGIIPASETFVSKNNS